jgi:hypothetical protein
MFEINLGLTSTHPIRPSAWQILQGFNAWLKESGRDVTKCRTRTSIQAGSEPTLVARIEDGTMFYSFSALCDRTLQDCVAVYLPGEGRGGLVGPRAQAWGEFDAAKFIRFAPTPETEPQKRLVWAVSTLVDFGGWHAEVLAQLQQEEAGNAQYGPYNWPVTGHESPLLNREHARAVSGGVQQHSLGDDYPLAIVGIGNGDSVHYEVHNLQRGTKFSTTIHPNGVKYRDAKSAQAALEVMKRRPELGQWVRA